MGDIMKNFLLVCFLIIFIPYLIVTIFVKDDYEKQVKFYIVTNQRIRVYRDKTKKIDSLPLEDYVSHVLAGEMPVNFDIEALKAQAVAARTYAVRKINLRKEKDYDVVDTVSDQVYLDDETLKKNWGKEYEEKINKIKSAVVQTKGQYLTYNGEIITAFFFSTSSGKTENSEEVFVKALPYLTSVDSSWDEISPVYHDSKTFTLKDFYNKLNLKYSPTLTYKVTEKSEAGSVKKITINNKEFTGKEVRQKLNLRSAYFSITKNDTNITINTKGFGHGVGMSQYGAEAMAQKGKKYDEILKYYYQGVEIKKI